MKQNPLFKLAPLPLLPLLFTLTGCDTCKPGKPPTIVYFPITVSLVPTLQDKDVYVDLVGVNEPNHSLLEAYSMTKYWDKKEKGDAMRANAIKKTFSFASGPNLTARLEPSDPIWSQWKAQSVSYVFVLVDLPGVHSDQPGSQDPRRRLLPLDKCYWILPTRELKDVKELKVNVTESGMQATAIPPK